MNYADTYTKLQQGVCVITFLKKDATVRNMLATRNKRIANIYGQFNSMQFDGHDKRCNIENGNIAVYDLIIDEVRSFNIGRLIQLREVGNVQTKEQLDMLAEMFNKFDSEYKKANPMELNMEMEMGGGE